MSTIYCDLDNVFNVPDYRYGNPNHDDCWGDYVTKGSFNVYSPKMIKAFNDLLDFHLAHGVWATTWEGRAKQFGYEVGITGCKEWEVLDAFECDLTTSWLKFDSVRKHYENNRPDKAIWIDDELKNYPNAMLWCQDNGILPIVPNEIYGLSANLIGDMYLHLMPELEY